MTLTKSLLSLFAALALSTGAAFAGGAKHDQSASFGSESMPVSSLETTDDAYFAQSEPMMTDPLTMAESGQTIEAYDVYYIVPMEVVEVEEIWLIPGSDDPAPLG